MSVKFNASRSSHTSIIKYNSSELLALYLGYCRCIDLRCCSKSWSEQAKWLSSKFVHCGIWGFNGLPFRKLTIWFPIRVLSFFIALCKALLQSPFSILSACLSCALLLLVNDLCKQYWMFCKIGKRPFSSVVSKKISELVELALERLSCCGGSVSWPTEADRGRLVGEDILIWVFNIN